MKNSEKQIKKRKVGGWEKKEKAWRRERIGKEGGSIGKEWKRMWRKGGGFLNSIDLKTEQKNGYGNKDKKKEKKAKKEGERQDGEGRERGRKEGRKEGRERGREERRKEESFCVS